MTNAQTLTLTGFLLARIAEDEEVAQQWPESPVPPGGIDAHGHPIWGARSRVLAECEAKRRIVAEHETIAAAYPNRTIETDPCCETCSAGGEYPGEFPCPTLRLLALPYADHPDHRQEWRP